MGITINRYCPQPGNTPISCKCGYDSYMVVCYIDFNWPNSGQYKLNYWQIYLYNEKIFLLATRFIQFQHISDVCSVPYSQGSHFITPLESVTHLLSRQSKIFHPCLLTAALYIKGFRILASPLSTLQVALLLINSYTSTVNIHE